MNEKYYENEGHDRTIVDTLRWQLAEKTAEIAALKNVEATIAMEQRAKWAEHNFRIEHDELLLAEKQLESWRALAVGMSRNIRYYCSLVESIGEMFGNDAYTADDGSKSQNLLYEKIPKLVAALVESRRRERGGKKESENETTI